MRGRSRTQYVSSRGELLERNSRAPGSRPAAPRSRQRWPRLLAPPQPARRCRQNRQHGVKESARTSGSAGSRPLPVSPRRVDPEIFDRRRPQGGCWCAHVAHLRQPKRQGGVGVSARTPVGFERQTWSLGRFEGSVLCAQETKCSPQRRIALGVSQHSTDSLTLLVAEDFHRARFALDHCASNRHRDVSQVLLSKPSRELPDLFRGA